MLLELPGSITWAIDELDPNPDISTWPLRRWFQEVVPEHFQEVAQH